MKKIYLFLLAAGLILSACGSKSNTNAANSEATENESEQTESSNDNSIIKDVPADQVRFIGWEEGEEKPEVPKEMLKYVGEKLNYCQVTKNKYSSKWDYVLVVYGLDANEEEFRALADYYRSIGGELTKKLEDKEYYDAVFPFGETTRCELFGTHAVTQLNFGAKQ